MNNQEHQARHIALHKAFDELLADYIMHLPYGESALDKTVYELVKWSHDQTIKPTEPRQ